MFFLAMFILLLILMALGLISIFGDTKIHPIQWGIVATIFGSAYAWFLISWGNFVEYIWIPAWETIMAQRQIGVYEIGAVILVFGVIIYVLSMIRTAYISWSKDGILTLSA